jgi:hypothetical protein
MVPQRILDELNEGEELVRDQAGTLGQRYVDASPYDEHIVYDCKEDRMIDLDEEFYEDMQQAKVDAQTPCEDHDDYKPWCEECQDATYWAAKTLMWGEGDG